MEDNKLARSFALGTRLFSPSFYGHRCLPASMWFCTIDRTIHSRRAIKSESAIYFPMEP